MLRLVCKPVSLFGLALILLAVRFWWKYLRPYLVPPVIPAQSVSAPPKSDTVSVRPMNSDALGREVILTADKATIYTLF